MIQQLFYGCGHSTWGGGPGSTPGDESPCGINKPIGGETAHLKITLDGAFLCFRQVVVNGIVGVEVVLADTSAPCLIRTVVAEIEIDDGLALQHLLQGGYILHLTTAGTAPCTPHIHIDDISPEWSYDVLE